MDTSYSLRSLPVLVASTAPHPPLKTVKCSFLLSPSGNAEAIEIGFFPPGVSLLPNAPWFPACKGANSI